VDGTSRKIENLRILATDVEADLAILAFPAGERPLVTRGLTFVTRTVEEGEAVFAAGFPGFGRTPIWQFSNGIISNASVRFPKNPNDDDDDTMMGPFIQHNAQVDGGNSGGPLLVAQQGAPSGFAVAGMNTLSATRRQAANFAIPANRIQTFINDALNPRPATFRNALDERLEKFVEGFGVNRAIYPHIAEFLSTASIGENAEWATDEMFRRASESIRRAFLRKFEESVVGAMGLAVAWTIEDSIRGSRSGLLRASIKEVTGEGEEYTVIFTINNSDVTSVWIREYGNWRIKTFGTVATGDTERIERRQNQRDREEGMRAESHLRLELGYANLFDKSSAAIYASIEISNFYGFSIYFSDPDFWSFAFFVTTHFPIPLENIGLMPYVRAGFAYHHDEEYENWKTFFSDSFFTVSIILQGGLRVFIPGVPGLSGNIGYQYNIFGYDSNYSRPFRMALNLSLGYSF
jgi:serine protease Do